MVELIVTFALLAIFLAAASMCISHAILNYYNEQRMMAAYSVADLVLSEVKDEVRTMQASKNYSGYVKLLTKDASGKLVASAESGGEYTGTTIEYVTSDLYDNRTAVQIDTEGCSDVLINEDGINDDYWEDLKSGYLTMRYYSLYPEKNIAGYKNLYMDELVAGTSAVTSGNYGTLPVGTRVVWHAQEKLAPPQDTEEASGSVYQNFTVSLNFTVKPEKDADNNPVVKYVDVSVDVNDANGMVYNKTRRVTLQNVVYYKDGSQKTMYSDGAETVVTPTKIKYTVEYYDTLGNSIRAASNFYGNAGDTISGERLQTPITGYTYKRSEGDGRLHSDMTIRLIYEADSYTISYEIDGGHIVNNPNPVTYKYGEDPGTIRIPDMEKGYRFVGWFADAAHTGLISDFSSAYNYNKGNITVYGYVEEQNMTVEGNIDGMENDDREQKFSDTMDAPDVLTANYGYDGNNIVYAYGGYNQNYDRISSSLAAALSPHSYDLDDVLVSTDVNEGPNNTRITTLFLLEKEAIKDLNISAASTGTEMIEAFLRYANREDVSKTETVTIEIPADAVAVYESVHDWKDNTSTDTKWEKINNPEPTVYLHMTVDRQLVTWNGEPHYWTYYNFAIWMTTSP